MSSVEEFTVSHPMRDSDGDCVTNDKPGIVYMDYMGSHPMLKGVKEVIQQAMEDTVNGQSAHVANEMYLDTKRALEATLALEYSHVMPVGRVILCASGTEANQLVGKIVGYKKTSRDVFGHASIHAITSLEGGCSGHFHTTVNTLTGEENILSSKIKVDNLYVDDIQGFLKHDLGYIRDLPVQAITVASHKIGGPAGIGAIILRKGVLTDSEYNYTSFVRGTPFKPLVYGFSSAIREFKDAYKKFTTAKYDVASSKAIGVVSLLNNSRVRVINTNYDTHCLAIAVKSIANDRNETLDVLNKLGIIASEYSACSIRVPIELKKSIFLQDDEDLIRLSWGMGTPSDKLSYLATVLNLL